MIRVLHGHLSKHPCAHGCAQLWENWRDQNDLAPAFKKPGMNGRDGLKSTGSEVIITPMRQSREGVSRLLMMNVH